MLGTSPLLWFLIAWGVITAVFVGLMIWKSLVGMREDDQIFLDITESGLAEEQRLIVGKVQRLTGYAKGFGFASAGLLILIAGMWLYRGLAAFNRPPMP